MNYALLRIIEARAMTDHWEPGAEWTAPSLNMEDGIT
jgi:hypothetical protein